MNLKKRKWWLAACLLASSSAVCASGIRQLEDAADNGALAEVPVVGADPVAVDQGNVCPDITGFYVCNAKFVRPEWEMCPDDVFRKQMAGGKLNERDFARCRIMAITQLRVHHGGDGVYFSVDPDDKRAQNDPEAQMFYGMRIGNPFRVDSYGRGTKASCGNGAVRVIYTAKDYAITTRGFAIVGGAPTRFVPYFREEISEYSFGLRHGVSGVLISERKTKIVSRTVSPAQETIDILTKKFGKIERKGLKLEVFDFLSAETQRPTLHFCRKTSAAELEQIHYLVEHN